MKTASEDLADTALRIEYGKEKQESLSGQSEQSGLLSERLT